MVKNTWRILERRRPRTIEPRTASRAPASAHCGAASCAPSPDTVSCRFELRRTRQVEHHRRPRQPAHRTRAPHLQRRRLHRHQRRTRNNRRPVLADSHRPAPSPRLKTHRAAWSETGRSAQLLTARLPPTQSTPALRPPTGPRPVNRDPSQPPTPAPDRNRNRNRTHLRGCDRRLLEVG